MTTDPEQAALLRQYQAGQIDLEEYQRAIRSYTRDVQAERDRQNIIAAGRGHLVR